MLDEDKYSKCKEQRTMCWKLFESELKSIFERLNGMDKALELQSRELERRLVGMNELREEFTRSIGKTTTKESFDTMSNRVTKLENKSFVWITVIVIFFTVLQVVLKWLK